MYIGLTSKILGSIPNLKACTHRDYYLFNKIISKTSNLCMRKYQQIVVKCNRQSELIKCELKIMKWDCIQKLKKVCTYAVLPKFSLLA